MRPVHRDAVEGVGRLSSVHAAVGGRADMYSLGAMLYEALGGSTPFRPRESLPLCRINPQVSVGLSDLIARCLEADPRRRYADAAGLVDDLRRHLTNQPLKGVRNRSLTERW